MGKDLLLKRYYSDRERYADLINGLSFQGRQVVRAEDIQELDSQISGFSGMPLVRKRRKQKSGCRDLIRRIALGINFIVIGIENQEDIDYSIPLRGMSYDAGEYEKQASAIRRQVQKNSQGLSPGEYMYGFRRDSRLQPCVTFILYYGEEEWDGPTDLFGMLNFQDIPRELRDFVPNYKVNLIQISKLHDTSVFHTDIRQVFNFIRCSGDPDALMALTENDPAYQAMEEDAFEVAAQYSHTEALIEKKKYDKGGRIDMSYAMTELIRRGREAGYNEGRNIGYDEGRNAGYSEGRNAGYGEGKNIGYGEGKNAGYNEGKNIGYGEGRNAGYSEGIKDERAANIQFLVNTCMDYHIPPDQIRERIMSRYGLSDSEAEGYMKNASR